MSRIMVAGNWKMHGARASVSELVNQIKSDCQSIAEVDWVVCPPFIFIDQVVQQLSASNVAVGAQNLASESQGAFTGEVSAAMIKDFGCQYVIVGHSERRTLYREDSQLVAKKFALAKEFNLKPILCVGESLEERDNGRTAEVVAEQLDAVLNLQAKGQALENAVVAYEPVWAIGTGKTATPEQAQQVHQAIRQRIAEHNPVVAEKIQILYGGSVKPDNAKALFAMPDIDGGLIGGASLKAEDFVNIGRAALG